MKLKGKGGRRGGGFFRNLFRKFVLTVGFFAAVVAIGYVAYQNIPSLQEKVDYFWSLAESTISKFGVWKSGISGIFIIVVIWAIFDSVDEKTKA